MVAAPPKQTKQRSISIAGTVLIVVYTMLPIAWILSLSLKSPGDLTNKKFLPTHWTLGNYLIGHDIHHRLAIGIDYGLAILADLLHLLRLDHLHCVIRLEILDDTL